MLHQIIFPLVLPLTAHPSARLDAEETLPPFFIGLAAILPNIPPIGFGFVGAGAGAGAELAAILPNIPPIGFGFVGAGFGVIGVAGAPVIVGFTPGLTGAAGIGFVGTLPGAYLII
jgi:hypothetical protein